MDWRQATEDQIRRAIAERLGYSVREVELSALIWPNAPYYAIFTPENVLIDNSQESSGSGKLDDAFIETMYADAAIARNDSASIPDWPNDANAALALPLAENYYWIIQPDDSIGNVVAIKTFYCDEAITSGNWDKRGNRIAMACCIAWLDMQDNPNPNVIAAIEEQKKRWGSG